MKRKKYSSKVGKDSVICPSNNFNGSLLVFVHGFRGRAISTWNDIPNLIDLRKTFQGSDILYYGYSSRPGRVQNMALNFQEDMGNIWNDPNALGNSFGTYLSIKKRQEQTWKCVHIIAHSMGAVVVRRAILDSYISKSPNNHWSKSCSFTFFAPAHTGVSIIELLKETYKYSGPLMKGFYPCLKDLEEESLTIQDMQRDYKSLDDNIKKKLIAKGIVLGEKDNVVNPNRFQDDPIPVQIKNRGHINMCKPNKGFLTPIDFMEKYYECK